MFGPKTFDFFIILVYFDVHILTQYWIVEVDLKEGKSQLDCRQN